MKKLFLSMIALLCYSQVAVASIDLLGLANLAEGSTPSYGESMVVLFSFTQHIEKYRKI